MKNKVYAVDAQEPNELERKNRALARRAAAEGFVLLKNENALPLRTKKIALYGMGARKTVKGGLGSGSVEERYSVNIEDGLKNAGYEITSEKWLDDYDAEYDRTYEDFRQMVESKIAGMTDPREIIPLAHSFVYRYPSGRTITQEDIQASDTDTAVYVLMRQAGEGNDRRLEKGDYYITDVEKENLKIVAEAYAHTILVINVGGLIDFGLLDEIPGINAVVLFVQGGEEGGNALADVLSGNQNFSGKLADTIPMKYEDIPFGGEFSYLNGNVKDEYYKEGIYVGYRYYDSFGKDVRYPFGYGLSYTTFKLETVKVGNAGSKIDLQVKVTNTGSAAGKEVVQVYLSAPESGINKEYQKLVSFRKTKELKPNESETVDLSFDLKNAAYYSERTACWMLDAGMYAVRIGSSSRETDVAAGIRLTKPVITEKDRNCCAPVADLGSFKPESSREWALPENVPVISIEADAFVTRTVDYAEPEFTETDEEKKFLDGLTPEEQAWLLQGGALQRPPKGTFDIPGAAGKTATALLDKGLTNVVMSDGPAGLNIVNQVHVLPDGSTMAAKIPERYNWGALRKMAAGMLARIPGPIAYRYATAWPVESLLAQSWNAELLEEIGDAVGSEMEEFGISVWLAPGMNIHRNPLGGRNFEYYSEDPLLSGTMAGRLARGVESHSGVSVCLKHFACNNSEDNRNGINANVSERALREIYLKGFEIAVKEAHPHAMMSSYNKINGVYTANRHDLLTDILRCEWGYDGIVMTDWGSCNEKAADPEECAPAGNDLIMPGGDFDRKRVLDAIHDGRMKPETVRKSAARVLRLILNSGVG